jgi:hypothetical protein
MFCPSCRDEFRAGFTRCAACNVDLVPELPSRPQAAPAPTPRRTAPQTRAAGPLSLADYCGFLAIEEAREARSRLRGRGIRSEIVVREAADAPEGEEYWLRVESAKLAEVAQELEYHQVEEPAAEPGFRCEACGAAVPEDAEACPGCGLKFEDAS